MSRRPGVFAAFAMLADWALKQDVDEHTYQSRYFAGASQMR
jgi:hypothetical protein